MEHLIYTDTALNDIGYAVGFSLDLENGKDNDFNFKVALSDFDKYKAGCYIYCEKSPEFGGKISTYSPNTASGTVTFAGRTWRGMFSRKYLCKSLNFASGTPIGNIIAELIAELNFSDTFEAVHNEHTISQPCTLNALGNALTELETLLSASGCRPSFVFDPLSKKIKIGADAIADYSTSEYDSRNINLELYINTMPVNHVVAVLGDGSLRHRYLHLDGTQSETVQEIKGANEVMSVIKVSNSADVSEAMQAAIDESLAAAQTCAVSVNSIDADIGDIVGGRESTTGIFVKSKITSKILKMTEFTSVVNFETGA